MQNFYFGSDYSIVNAARVSFNKDSHSIKSIVDEEKDKKLIKFLYEHQHFSVFEHILFYIHRNNINSLFFKQSFNPEEQIFKSGNYIILSGRKLPKFIPFLSEKTLEEIENRYPAYYSVLIGKEPQTISNRKNLEKPIVEELECGYVALVDYLYFEADPKYSIFTFCVEAPIFVARQWMRHRFASYNELSRRYTKSDVRYYLPKYKIVEDEELNEDLIKMLKKHSEMTINLYYNLINRGVRKEVARFVLPLNIMTRFYFTAFLASLENFINLRIKEDAQYEIRQYAKAIKNILEKHIY